MRITTPVIVWSLAVICSCLTAPIVEASEDRHTLWTDILATWTDEGLVDYVGLIADPQALELYFRELEAVGADELESWSREDQLAYWLNAYNAFTLKAILDHYPIKRGGLKALIYPVNSIRQIPGVWDELLFAAAGRQVTLNEIEHQIIRGGFADPRIHFALVCAALGCPILRAEAYEGSLLEEQLDDDARRFVGNYAKVHYDAEADELWLSSIFKWFGADFEPHGGVVGFVQSWLPADTSARITASTPVRWFKYDWTLNTQAPNAAGTSEGRVRN